MLQSASQDGLSCFLYFVRPTLNSRFYETNKCYSSLVHPPTNKLFSFSDQKLSARKQEMLCCTFCNRQAGLWNFFSVEENENSYNEEGEKTEAEPLHRPLAKRQKKVRCGKIILMTFVLLKLLFRIKESHYL